MNAPLKVLLLEDREEDAKLLVHALEDAGYDVHAKRVETEADFEAALDPSLDVILADYALPNWDGPAALASLQRSGLDVPLIVVSGVIGDEAAAAIMQHGAADFLLKDRLARLGLAVAQAITQAHLRREHRLAAEALRAAHSQLSQLLAHNPAVLYRVPLAGGDTPRVTSGSVTALLGITPSETTDFHWWLECLHPDDRKRVVDAIAETMVTGASQVEYRLRHKNGDYRWVDDRRRLVCDETGKAVEIVGVWIDISERKASEALRERLLAELQAAHATVKVLSGLLPICASCKKIRDDQGYWHQVEVYIRQHSEANFTHGLCPDCVAKFYPGMNPAEARKTPGPAEG